MRKSFVTVVAVLAVPATLAVAGPASAASPNQRVHQVITFDASQPPDAPGVIDSSGAVSGSGLNYTTSNRPTGKASHDTESQVFDDGTISIKDSGPEKSDSFDAATCTDTFSGAGQFKVTGGTGAYAGISGHGHYVENGQVTFPQTSDGCDFNEPTGTITVTVDGFVRR